MKRMNVVMLEPNREAYIAEIDGSLNGMQAVVDGFIEAVYPFNDDVCLICNEEGKLQHLPLNRAIYNEDGTICDVIAGTAFICACGGDSFSSLGKTQLEKYKKMFLRPEAFLLLNGRIVAIPV